MPATQHQHHDQHDWDDQTPEQVLQALVYELYPPVSALGDEIDRLVTGAFDDEELMPLLEQLRSGINQLSRIVVALKRYTADHAETSDGSAGTDG